MDPAPVAVEKVPMGHAEQVAMDTAPVPAEKVPVPHAIQEEAPAVPT